MNDLRPRKEPQQERARATVEAILDATAQVLVEEGYHKTSTNRIAERAGVSVGSLYQYFPNRDSIVAAVVARYADTQFEDLALRLQGLEGKPLSESIHGFIRAFLENKQRNPRLDRVLFEELPQVGQIDVLKDWTERTVSVVRAVLESRQETLRPGNLALAAHMLVTACHGVVHETVINRPELLSDDEFAHEFATLILAYLDPQT